jgi:hypothetical protein
MTDEVKNEETTATPEVPKFETGFLVIKSAAGSWHVLTDLSAPLSIDRESTLNEVRVGASEVVYALSQQQLAAMLLSALAPQTDASAPETETDGTIKE